MGLVSLAGVTDELWCVKNGNKQVPQKLLEASSANVLLNTDVKLIAKDDQNPDKNVIVYQTGDENEVQDNSFDYVIIGFPLYKGVIGDEFKLDFDTADQFNYLEMQLTNTYLIYGTVKLFSNLPTNKHINLHSVDPFIPYRTVCVQLPCDYSKKDDADLYLDKGEKFYKIFSEQELDESVFNRIFMKNYQLVEQMPWLAYPKYKVNPETKVIPDVILDGADRSRVFYLNSLEWSSSCMEICSISARNVSLLVCNKENNLKPKRKKYFSQKHSDSKFNSYLHKICGVTTILVLGSFILSVYF